MFYFSILSSHPPSKSRGPALGASASIPCIRLQLRTHGGTASSSLALHLLLPTYPVPCGTFVSQQESQTTNSTLEVNPKPASPPKKRRGLRVLHTHAEEGEEATRTNAGSRKTVVIGIGSGRCGTMSLATLLNKQPGTQVRARVCFFPTGVPSRAVARALDKRASCAGSSGTGVGWPGWLLRLYRYDPNTRAVVSSRET